MGNCRFKGNFFLLSCWKCGKYTLFLLKTKKQGMKIVYVYDAIARIGGVERILVDKMNYLAEVYGYEVYLITAAQGNHPFSFPLSNKVKHIDIDARFHVQYQYKYPKRLWMKWKLDRRFKLNLEKQIQQIDPDIVIGTTYYKADIICNLKCRAKKIIESHCAKSHTGQNEGKERSLIMEWLYKRQLAKYNQTIETKSDVIVTLTKGDASEWERKEGIFTIPNMTKLFPGKEAAYKAHRVISVGRLVYQKGYDRLIDVWKIVNQKHPDWKLDIFGKGELQDELQKQISENHLEKSIKIYPPISNITEEYLHSSIYVTSSRFEGFALVLIEAMSCGLPCISYDCPYGPSDLIKNNENGFLVENGNTQQMASAICSMIDNQNIRQKFGKNAKQTANQYNPNNIMHQWYDLFNKIMTK